MSNKSKGRDGTALQRAALIAAAGIAVAGVASTAQGAETSNSASPIKRTEVTMTTRGTAIHSEALVKLFKQDRPRAIEILKSRFPGLTEDQIEVNENSTIMLRMDSTLVAHGTRRAMGDDSGCHNNGMCNAARKALESPMSK